MKKELKGAIIGMILGSLLTSGLVYAKSGSQNIEVTYDNIKVYKDNVLCELKDANGSTIEPFIYNGTTYMPVRGTAQLADMQVTWDGNSKSVYLWDNMVPNGTYLMEVCPPYETSAKSENYQGQFYKSYLQSKGESFLMSGEKYSNGFTLASKGRYALFNLNGKYASINFVIGHVDGSNMTDNTVSFFIDGKLVDKISVGAEDMPKTVSLPVNYGLQLKVVVSDYSKIGFGNITIQ